MEQKSPTYNKELMKKLSKKENTIEIRKIKENRSLTKAF